MPELVGAGRVDILKLARLRLLGGGQLIGTQNVQIIFFIVSNWIRFKKCTHFVHVHFGGERVVILEMC